MTCTVGNFSAYKQRSVKRLLAYSSIAHAGYMMMAAAVFIHPDVAGHEAGLAALLTYIVIYLFMNLGAFGVTALVAWDTDLRTRLLPPAWLASSNRQGRPPGQRARAHGRPGASRWPINWLP